jgi:hypothetical protein
MNPPRSEFQPRYLLPLAVVLAATALALFIALCISLWGRFALPANFDLARAALIALLSILTAISFFMFVRGIESEKGLSFQSYWGGLGGGLGGWRISRPVVYLVATGVLIMLLASVVSSWSDRRNSADLGFLYLADKYMPALVAAQQNKIGSLGISTEQSKLHLTGVAPDQKAVNAVWDQIKQINPRYGEVWVDFTLATKPALGPGTK